MDTTSRPPWRKSTYSNSNSNCVEAAQVPGAVAVRDGKDPGWPTPGHPGRDLAGVHLTRPVRPLT